MKALASMNVVSNIFEIVIACVVISGGSAFAHDDMTKAAPNQVKILFENDRVRVLETTIKPGDKIPMHSHSTARVVYFSNAFSEKITRSGREPQIYHRQVGTVDFNEAESLTVENVSAAEGRNIVVELKEKR